MSEEESLVFPVFCVAFYSHVLNAEVLPASVSSELSHVFKRRLVNNAHPPRDAPLPGHFGGLLSCHSKGEDCSVKKVMKG